MLASTQARVRTVERKVARNLVIVCSWSVFPCLPMSIPGRCLRAQRARPASDSRERQPPLRIYRKRNVAASKTSQVFRLAASIASYEIVRSMATSVICTIGERALSCLSAKSGDRRSPIDPVTDFVMGGLDGAPTVQSRVTAIAAHPRRRGSTPPRRRCEDQLLRVGLMPVLSAVRFGECFLPRFRGMTECMGDDRGL